MSEGVLVCRVSSFFQAGSLRVSMLLGSGKRLHFAPHLRSELGLAGKMQFVAAGEYLPLLIRTERVPHHGVVLVRAEDQPERWIGHAVRDLFQS